MAATSKVMTASGVVKAGPGRIHAVNVTKVATGTGVVRLWDNASAASGTKLYEGDGLTEVCHSLTSPDGGTVAPTGIYCELGGTTSATVVVVFE